MSLLNDQTFYPWKNTTSEDAQIQTVPSQNIEAGDASYNNLLKDVSFSKDNDNLIKDKSELNLESSQSTVLKPAESQPLFVPQSKAQTQRNKIKTWLKILFGTRQLVPKTPEHRKEYIAASVIESAIYLLYLLICLIIVFGSTSPKDYYYAKVISDLFLDTPFNDSSKTTFRTSVALNDFWKFTDTVLLNGLYWEEWYHDSLLHIPVKQTDRGILYENKILGSPRLRQIRVKATTCPVDHLARLGKESVKCFPYYSTSYEDKGSYGVNTTSDTAWMYQSSDKLKSGSYLGKLHEYSGAGAYVLLSNSESVPTKKIIQGLKKGLWIKRQTRVVFLEFTVYNANINLFCVTKLVWEFSPTGAVITSWTFRAVRLIRYINGLDYFILTCELIFLLFTIYYTIQEVVSFVCLGCRKYWFSFWTYLELLILAISYSGIFYSIYRAATVSSKNLEEMVKQKDKYVDLDSLAFWEIQFNNAMSICLFLIWIKCFKYISFNATMSTLSITLSRCAKDIGGFAIMFFIVFFAFAQLGYLLFGSQVRDFSSIFTSIFALLRLLLGDFNFAEIQNANRVLGPLFFLSYIFFVFFVLLHMFLAIINDTYGEVKLEMQGRKNLLHVTDYIKEKVGRISLQPGKRNSAATKNESSVADLVDEGKVTSSELRSHLLGADFTQVEVDLFLLRYELDQDHALDSDETRKLIAELNGEKIEDFPDPQNGMKANSDFPVNEIERLDQRITTMEASISGVLGKMDTIISKFNPSDDIR